MTSATLLCGECQHPIPCSCPPATTLPESVLDKYRQRIEESTLADFLAHIPHDRPCSATDIRAALKATGLRLI